MKWMYGFLFASLLSVGTALTLSYFSQLNGFLDERKPELSVFSGTSAKQLDDEGLVDLLASIPLNLSILKVEWSYQRLTLELAAEPGSLSPQMIYHDLYTITRSTLAEKTNVDRVMIKVSERGTGGEVMLLALDARKDQLSRPDQAAGGAMTPEAYLRSRFSLTYTSLWRMKYEA